MLLPTSSKPRHATSAARFGATDAVTARVWSEQSWALGSDKVDAAFLGVKMYHLNIPNIQKLIILHNIYIYIYKSIIYIFYHTLSYLIYVSTGWNIWQGPALLAPFSSSALRRQAERGGACADAPIVTAMTKLKPNRLVPDRSPTGPPFKVVISL